MPLKLFGCVTYVHVQPGLRSKLDLRSIKCIFLGYSNSQMGYKCYSPANRRIYVTLDVIFDEKHVFYRTIEETEELKDSEYELPNLPSSTI